MFRRSRLTHRSVLVLAASLIAPTLLATAAPAQSLQQRIENVRRQRAQQEARQQRSIRQRLQAPLTDVQLRDLTAREAFQWISQNGDVPLLINWDRLQQSGIDPQQQVELTARRVSVRGAMEMLLSQIAVDRQPILEVTPNFVRVMSRDQANQNPVIRVYPIGDLTMRTPNFTNAPEFDLEQITQGSSGGGTGGGSQGGLFDDANQQQDENDPFAQPGFNPAERIAGLIRETVEPDLWRANGGLHGSIQVFGNNLVIRAPKYVHRRIGGDPHRTGARTAASNTRSGGGDGSADRPSRGNRRASPNRRGNAGIDRSGNRPRSNRRQTRDGTAGVEKRRPYPNR